MRKQYFIPETEVTPLFSASVLCASGNEFNQGGGGDPINAI